MSQSDYLKYKRVATVLRKNDQPPVMESQNYIDFKEFALVNSITTSKPLTNQIVLPDRRMIFDMEKKVSGCPTFPVCINTHQRTNRVPMSTVYFTPIPSPLSIKATKNAANQRTACQCVLDSKNTHKNICRCRTGHWGIVR